MPPRYRLPKESQVRIWCETVPAKFLYTVKLSHLITHRRSLIPRVDEFIENYMQRARCFDREKIAQILVQFPPYLERNDDHLQQFLERRRDIGRFCPYPPNALRRWAKRIRSLSGQARDLFVYVNNDTQAAAPRDAMKLRELL